MNLSLGENDPNHHSQQQSSVENIAETSVSDKSIEDSMKGNLENVIDKSKSPSTSSCNEKNISPKTNDQTLKKSSSKKKKPCDIRTELMRELLAEFKATGEYARESDLESRATQAKQVKLQEDSLNNDKEFLNIFRMIGNIYYSNHCR